MEDFRPLPTTKLHVTYQEIISAYAMWCDETFTGEKILITPKKEEEKKENKPKSPKKTLKMPQPPVLETPEPKKKEQIVILKEKPEPRRTPVGRGTQRGHRKWEGDETNALIKGIEEFGAGDWASIYNRYRDIFDRNERNRMDLSRRWQTLKEQGKYKELWDRVSSKSNRK